MIGCFFFTFCCFSGALAGNPFNVDREFLAKGTVNRYIPCNVVSIDSILPFSFMIRACPVELWMHVGEHKKKLKYRLE